LLLWPAISENYSRRKVYKRKGEEMKKRLLSAILVAGIAVAPMVQADTLKGAPKVKKDLPAKLAVLKDVFDIIKEFKGVLSVILEGLGLKNTAEGFEELNDAIKMVLEELEKPTDEIDFSKLLVIVAETNEIALAMNEDLKKIMLILVKPLKKILPAKEIKFGKKTVMLDDVPAILTEKAIDVLGLYYKLVAKLMNTIVKVKETVKPKEDEEIPAMAPGQIIMEEETVEETSEPKKIDMD